MNRYFRSAPLLSFALMAGILMTATGNPAAAQHYSKKTVPAVLNFTMQNIDGKSVSLSKYRGKVILMVNVASLCGNTPQYTALEALYERYRPKGLVVLGFPANDFMHQEPGTDKEIKSFCTSKYKITFPMFSKIVVKGDGQAPLYQFLTDKQTDPLYGGDIDWNFAKFLINRKGEIIGRFPARTDPQKPEVISAIEKALAG